MLVVPVGRRPFVMIPGFTGNGDSRKPVAGNLISTRHSTFQFYNLSSLVASAREKTDNGSCDSALRKALRLSSLVSRLFVVFSSSFRRLFVVFSSSFRSRENGAAESRKTRKRYIKRAKAPCTRNSARGATSFPTYKVMREETCYLRLHRWGCVWLRDK